MPPKPKFTIEQVAQTALEIVKQEGVDALTARELGKRLNASASPIFTVFRGMDEVKAEARVLGLREFETYIGDFRDYTPAFKRIGMRMVSYAIRHPEMFKFLFMQEHPGGQSFGRTIADLGGMTDTCVMLIRRDYGMTEKEALLLFEQLWVHAFGLGALCAMKVCDLTETEISEQLGQVFAGMVMVIRSGKLTEAATQPSTAPTWNADGRAVGDLPFLKES